MTTPSNQPTPPDGMRLLTPEEYLQTLPNGFMLWTGFDFAEIPENVGKMPCRRLTYAIPITPTVPATGDADKAELRARIQAECRGREVPEKMRIISGDTTNEKGGEPCTHHQAESLTIPASVVDATSTTAGASNAALNVPTGEQRQELLPCPFCGGTNILVDRPHHGDPVHYVAICTPEVDRTGCGASSTWKPSQKEAAESWNTRK